MTVALFTRDEKHLYGLIPLPDGRYWRYRCGLCGGAGQGQGRRRALHAYHAHYRRWHSAP